ncbi:MAG: hypothetical protein H6742_05585 [Alphaproteobacteria bacterium]|nr:hypothetical protein [Alphaproteobacteria bacterium]
MTPLLLLAALAGGSDAHAASEGPWMWGVGPSLGTIVYPGRFPSKLPDAYNELEGQVRGDGILGVHGVLYIDGENRIGSHLDLGLGKGFNSIAWTLEYERILVRGNGIHVFGGGGLGFGSYTLTDVEEPKIGSLTTPTYEVRAQFGALYKQKTTAEELAFFVKVPLNGNPTFTPAGGGERVDAEGGGNWFHVGLQATVYFGDWTKPKSDKKKGNKKKARG